MATCVARHMKASVAWRKLQALQAELMADDIPIDESMCEWSIEEMTKYFESGGEIRPEAPSAPAPSEEVEAPPGWRPEDPELWRLWFPRWEEPEGRTKLRLVCIHPKGSSADFWYAFDPRGSRRRPLLDISSSILEMVVPELPGRGKRWAEQPITEMRKLTQALAVLLQPMLMDGTPYALAGHSMGSWIAFDLWLQLKILGVPSPVAFFGNCFPSPSLPVNARPWQHGDEAHPQLGPDGTLPAAIIEGVRKLGTPEAALSPGHLRSWWPTFVSDHYIYDMYEWSGDTMPCKLFVTWAEEDSAVTSEMVAMWEVVASSAGFEKYDLQTAHHLFMKDDDHRVEWQEWVLQKLRTLTGLF